MLSSATLTELDIIPLTPSLVKAQIERLQEIASDIPKECWTLENYLHELPRKWVFSLAIAEKQTGLIAGFIIASDKQTSIHIHKYAVHSNLRSMGCGALMLSALENKVRVISESRAVTLFVDAGNDAAIRFYERKGFVFTERVESMAFFRKSLTTVVAIHQPNFLPWLGFFNKIASADKFIILDHVLNNPSDGIYPKRVSIVCNSQPFMLSIPLVKNKECAYIPINKMLIAEDKKAAAKQLKTVEASYKKTPFFRDYFYLVENFYAHPSPFISERNIDAIKEICRILELDTPLYRSSDYSFDSSSNELLIDLIKEVKGNEYLHGSYAVSEKGYQDNELFEKNGIQTRLQHFKHPVYRQFNNKGEFISGTSIIDALMNQGAEAVIKYVTQL